MLFYTLKNTMTMLFLGKILICGILCLYLYIRYLFYGIYIYVVYYDNFTIKY